MVCGSFLDKKLCFQKFLKIFDKFSWFFRASFGLKMFKNRAISGFGQEIFFFKNHETSEEITPKPQKIQRKTIKKFQKMWKKFFFMWKAHIIHIKPSGTFWLAWLAPNVSHGRFFDDLMWFGRHEPKWTRKWGGVWISPYIYMTYSL